MSEARRYGQWAGNERGTPENPHQCIVQVPADRGSFLYRQCSRPRNYDVRNGAVVSPGPYCLTHAKQAAKGRALHIPEPRP